jgi:hypothetical protein
MMKNDEGGTMNDEVEATRLYFIVHRSAFIVCSLQCAGSMRSHSNVPTAPAAPPALSAMRT